MPLHKESLFRYIVICFAVAVFGLLTSWNKMETERRINMSSVEASLSTQSLPASPLSNPEPSEPQ